MNQSLSVNAALSRIAARSNQYISSHPPPIRSPSPPPLRVPLDLPEPPALLPALVAAGARPEVAQAMQAAYYKRACEYREEAQAAISRVWSKLAQIPSTCSHTFDETILATFKQIYLTKLNSWISEGVSLVQEKGPSVLCYQKDDERAQAKVPNTFNHQYTPLLEHFFEENPFPTQADKSFLAKKSNMTYRQIHVWFQNRRNRSKKALHKKPVSEGATVPLDTLIRRMGKFAVPPITKSDTQPSSQRISFSSTETLNFCNGVAPPHAFPTTYPPICGYDPFPAVPTFSTPEWPRRPANSSGRARQSVVDVNKLIEKFSRMNVWDDAISRSRRKAGKIALNGFAATIAITVKPSPAPHPACILTAVAEKPLPRIVLHSVEATTSPLDAFRPPSPGVPMTTLIPTNSRRRKISPLPHRVPSRRPRGASESSTSSASPISSSSRSSSLESESPIQDGRAGYHWSSNSSSTVTTPETSPSPLAALVTRADHL